MVTGGADRERLCCKIRASYASKFTVTPYVDQRSTWPLISVTSSSRSGVCAIVCSFRLATVSIRFE